MKPTTSSNGCCGQGCWEPNPCWVTSVWDSLGRSPQIFPGIAAAREARVAWAIVGQWSWNPVSCSLLHLLHLLHLLLLPPQLPVQGGAVLNGCLGNACPSTALTKQVRWELRKRSKPKMVVTANVFCSAQWEFWLWYMTVHRIVVVFLSDWAALYAGTERLSAQTCPLQVSSQGWLLLLCTCACPCPHMHYHSICFLRLELACSLLWVWFCFPQGFPDCPFEGNWKCHWSKWKENFIWPLFPFDISIRLALFASNFSAPWPVS